MQTVFKMEDCSTLDWNGIEMPLSYKYDLSIMADDIVEMVLAIENAVLGTFEVAWPSSGFPYKWAIAWNASTVKILATAMPVPGAEDLTGRESVQTSRSDFVAGWRDVLWIIFSCLEASGYKDTQLAGLKRLRLAARRPETAQA